MVDWDHETPHHPPRGKPHRPIVVDLSESSDVHPITDLLPGRPVRLLHHLLRHHWILLVELLVMPMDRNKALNILLEVKQGRKSPLQALDELDKLTDEAIRDSQPPPNRATLRS